MRRTAGNVQRRNCRLIPLSVQSAGNGARARRDEESRLRHRRVRLIERKLHVRRNRSRQIHGVGMTRRGGELYPETRHVPRRSTQNVRVKLARGAAAGGNLAQMKRAFERQRPGVRLNGRHIFFFASFYNEVFATKHSKSVLFGETNFFADLRAASAEDASSHVEPRLAVVERERVRDRTYRLHDLDIFSRRIGVNLRTAFEIRRKIGRGGRKRPRSATFSEPRYKRL